MRIPLLMVPLALLLALLPAVATSQKCADDILITIEREECFGGCPVYSARIYAEGTVVYVGKRYVPVKGERRFKISQENIQALIKEFKRADYWILKYKYDTNENGVTISDLPTTTTSICLNGKKTTVVNYFGAPDKLFLLEDRIEELAGIVSMWKEAYERR